MFIIFAYCFYGDQTTSNYGRFANVLYETNWYEYELPTQKQKYFILMISNAKKPAYYRGMYLINVNLIVFRKVLSVLPRYYFNMKVTCFYFVCRLLKLWSAII